MGIHHHILLSFLFLAALPLSTSYHHHNHHHHRTLLQSSKFSCPLNFDLLRRLVGSRRPNFDPATACQQGLRLVEADYLRYNVNVTTFDVPSLLKPPFTVYFCVRLG